jgi:hypothetical protein
MMNNISLFSKPGKFNQRDVFFDWLPKREYNNVSLMPGPRCLDLLHGIETGAFSNTTKFVLIEKDTEFAAQIKETISDNSFIVSDNCCIMKHSRGFEAMDIAVIASKQIDLLYWDTCNAFQENILAWLARSLLFNSTRSFSPLCVFAATFCVKTVQDGVRTRLGLTQFLDKFDAPTNPGITLADWDADKQHGDEARKIAAAIESVLPGNVVSSNIYLYRSSSLPMVTVMFDVYISESVCRSKVATLSENFDIWRTPSSIRQEKTIAAPRSKVVEIDGTPAGLFNDLPLRCRGGDTTKLAKINVPLIYGVFKELGISVAKFADKANVNPSTVFGLFNRSCSLFCP